jgi:hypothetical protein
MLRRLGRGRYMLFFSAVLISMIALAPAAGAACPGVDPQCVNDTVDQAGSGLPSTSDPPGENVPGPVQDAVDTVKDTAGSTVGQVKDTIDSVLNPGGDGGGGPGGGGDGGGFGGGGSDGGGNGGSAPPAQGPSVPGGGSTPYPALLPQAPLNGPVPSGTVGSPSLIDRIGRGAVGTAKQLGFPLALALIVVAFLLIQDRVDRRDPKLALAPITPDVSRFA